MSSNDANVHHIVTIIDTQFTQYKKLAMAANLQYSTEHQNNLGSYELY